MINSTKLHIQNLWLIPLNWQPQVWLCRNIAIKCGKELFTHYLGKSAKFIFSGEFSLVLSALIAKRCENLFSFESHSLPWAFNTVKMLHSFIGIYIYAKNCSGRGNYTTGIHFQKTALLSWAKSWLISPPMTSSGLEPSLCSLHSPRTPQQSEALYPKVGVSWVILLPFKQPLQRVLTRH